MAIALVQSKHGGTGSGTTSATTSSVGFDSTTTAGNLLICVCWADADANIPIIGTPVASGFTWALQNSATYTHASTQWGRVSVYAIVDAGAMSVTTHFTATRSGASFTRAEFALYEFSGVQTSTPLDTSAINSNGSSSAPTTADLSTSATDLILVSYISDDGSVESAGPGFSPGVVTSIITSGKSQYILNQAAGTIATAFGSSAAHWGCVAQAFKSASSDGTATPSGVSMTATQNAPSTSGSAVASPAGVSMTSGVDAPLGTVSVTASVSGLLMTAQVGQAAGQSTSTAIALPTGVSMTSAVGSPTTQASSTISATGVSMAITAGSPTTSATFSTITVTGNLKDLLGIANPGSVKFTLGGYASPPKATGIMISQFSVTAQADGNGLISQQLIANDGISPAGTFYTAVFFNSLGAFVSTAKYSFTVDTNLSTYASHTYTELAVDSFSRADESPINPANWTTGTGFAALAVVSGFCESPDSITFLQDSFAFYSGASFPPDQYGEITLAALSVDGLVYIACRTDALGNGYSAACSGPLADPAGQIDLICENTITTLGTWIGTLNVGDVVRVECIDTAISVKLNGVVIISVIDSNAGSGSVGVNLSPFSVVGDAVISRFAAGSIS